MGTTLLRTVQNREKRPNKHKKPWDTIKTETASAVQKARISVKQKHLRKYKDLAEKNFKVHWKLCFEQLKIRKQFVVELVRFYCHIRHRSEAIFCKCSVHMKGSCLKGKQNEIGR